MRLAELLSLYVIAASVERMLQRLLDGWSSMPIML